MIRAAGQSSPAATSAPPAPGAAREDTPTRASIGASRLSGASRRRAATQCKVLTVPPLRVSTLLTGGEIRDWNASPVSVKSPQPHRYPNPGFLGPSSYSAIFKQLSSSAGGNSPGPRAQNAGGLVPNPSPADMANDEVAVSNSVTALRQLGQLDVANLVILVNNWLSEGVNLPLAGPMVPTCVEGVSQLWCDVPVSSTGGSRLSDWISERARLLLKNTHIPLSINGDTTFESFLAQMRGDSVRWETLGIFITAATRAALDTLSFPPLYSSEEQRRGLITALTSLGDSCLEKCLAVDFLNGLQLMLQYENFVVHSQVEGDQSESNLYPYYGTFF